VRTITFYSYKGGVGRSLLVANAARYLSTLGKKVFALDLDLEAPGLHYKFELGRDSVRTHAMVGVVDILTDFLKKGALPSSLDGYTSQITVAPEAGVIQLMRAGTAPQGDYWQKLSRVNWYDLFYGPEPLGAPFFLELKERIRRAFAPDFLLIDARTGMTEMGGVAATLLADTVVCLALASIEHLEGLRAVMRGIRQSTSREYTSTNVMLVPVLSRLPPKKEVVLEEQDLTRVRTFLNEPLESDGVGLDVDEVIVLHREPLLDLDEQLLVGGQNSPHELPLLRDYLRLFSKIIPAEDIRPHVGQLIQRATNRLLDDPDSAQSDLEALTTYCADEEAFRALLKLYLVRKVPLEKLLATAALMWQLGASSSESYQLLWNIVRAAYSEPRATDAQKKYADFAEAIWRFTGMKDIRVGMTIVNSFSTERKDVAIRLLTDYVDKADPPDPAPIGKLVDLLRSNSMLATALSVIDRFKATVDGPDFQTAWARVALSVREPSAALRTIEDKLFRADAVRAEDPLTLYRLFRMVGAPTASDLLREVLEEAVSKGNMRFLRDMAIVMYDEGRLDDFHLLARGRVPSNFLNELETELKQRRRSRFLNA
jgi:hypothetical protein